MLILFSSVLLVFLMILMDIFGWCVMSVEIVLVSCGIVFMIMLMFMCLLCLCRMLMIFLCRCVRLV